MKALISRSLLTLPVALGIVFSVSAQDLNRGLQNYSDILDKKKKVDQLSSQELQEVILVFKRLIDESSAMRTESRLSYESHEIEVSHFEKGDKVVFLNGRPLGVCVSTELLNLRNDRVCRIWCQQHTGLMESKH